MRLLALALCCAVGAALQACATPSDVQQMAVPTSATATRVTAGPLYRAINIAAVEVGDLPLVKSRYPWQEPTTNPAGSVTPESFAAALASSMRSADLLAESAAGARYDFKVKVLQPDSNSYGRLFTVSAVAWYTLVHRATNREIYRGVVKEFGQATYDDALIGVNRFKIAAERAYRLNIETFLKEVSALAVPEPGARRPVVL